MINSHQAKNTVFWADPAGDGGEVEIYRIHNTANKAYFAGGN